MSAVLSDRAAPRPAANPGAVRLSVEVAALTHRGARRHRNEDTIAIGSTLIRGPFPPVHVERFPLDARRVLLVADGLGGHTGGDVASCYAAAHLAELLDRKDSSERAIRQAVQTVNREIFAAMEACPTHAGMGTTVAGLHFGRNAVIAFNAGDSRIYRWAGGCLTRVSVDDRQAGTGAVTRTLGGAFAYVQVEPHVTSAPAVRDDRWLICSDGLSDLVPEPAIDSALAQDLVTAASRLAGLALAAGGDDNISIVLATITEARKRRLATSRA